ncbi:MAG: cadherin repeat domain-containing protein [Opitutae bacterium]|jgi:hypothetical protein|nr:cadherin repeat domain-containing protein [Opitutae bacterium]
MITQSWKAKARFLSLSWACLIGMSLHGALVTVTQDSQPSGFLSNTEALNTGSVLQLTQPALTQNGYTFGFWKRDGVRLSDEGGRSLTSAAIEVNGTMSLTAHYFQDNEDSDGDEIKDWFEYRNFGNLDQNLTGDPDGDGFNNLQESELGQEATVRDLVEDGGVSGRQSSAFVYGHYLLAKCRVYSSPLGFVPDEEGYGEANGTLTSPNVHGESFGYHFAYWTVNGVRQAGPSGVALSQAQVKIETNDLDMVAHYVPSNQDSDGDGFMDWYELYHFGDLSQGMSNDSDADFFTNAQELALGQEATIKDLVEDGGASSRTSVGFVYADPSLVRYTLGSVPVGFVETSDSYVNPGTIVHTPSLHGDSNGFTFAYWSINGARQAGPSGVAKSKLSFTLTANALVKAHYIETTLDSDGDGIKDWYEYYHFGDLSQGPQDDPDGDSFSNLRESALGQEATIVDSVEDGGISSRASTGFLYMVLGNRTPYGVAISQNEFFEREPAGLTVGRLLPLDYDDPNQADAYTYALVSTGGANDNGNFSLTGDLLKTTVPMEIASYVIRVRITDSGNASRDYDLVLSAVSNGDKDEDGDGLTLNQELSYGTDPKKFDTDGDGFSDKVEIDWGTNPLDPASLPNRVPTGLTLSSNTVMEGMVKGTKVGDLNGVDVDQTTGFGFTLVSGNGSTDNNSFEINQKGELVTKKVLDYESKSLLSVRIRVADQFNATFEKTFSIEVIDAFRPLPSTYEAVSSGLASFDLTGRILSDGGVPVTKVGFLLDRNLRFDSATTIRATLNASTGLFSTELTEVDLGEYYYFRAYAENSEGFTYGSIKRFRVEVNSGISKWGGRISLTGAGWATSSWFGSFMMIESEWIYHETLGWLYPAAQNDGSVWFWSHKHGWHWTQDGLYPYFYRWRDLTWLYYMGLRKGRLVYWNYSTLKYE